MSAPPSGIDRPPPSPAAREGPVEPSRGIRGWFSRNRAPVALVVLAITIPELLTGSTPVWNLLNPFAVAGLLGFYGTGVLLVREASIVYRRGWSMVLLLGLAYGVAEEGISTKTMVDPSNGAAGFLGVYGHLAGINWVFAVVIALFHALYSIALPILLVELLYPETKGVRFLSDRGAGWTIGTLAAAVTVGYFGFDPHYFEGYAVLGFLLVVMGVLVALAFVVPARWLEPRTVLPTLSPASLGWLGVGFAAGWSLFYLLAPHVVPFPVVVIIGELATCFAVLLIVTRTAGSRQNERHKVYFAAGLLSWYLPWDFIVTFALRDYLIGAVVALVFVMLWRIAGTYPASPAVLAGPGPGEKALSGSP